MSGSKYNPLEQARSLAEIATKEAQPSESARTLTAPLVDAMWDTGLLKWMNPGQLDADAPTFVEAIDVWQELARQYGSLGWVAMANMTSAMAAATYLPDAGYEEVFGDESRRVTLGGQFFPNGSGDLDGDQYTVTGAWNFGSGTGHSEYVAGGFFPVVDGEAKFDLADIQAAFFHRDDVSFDDGWYVQGLRGTGSYDYSVNELVVPASRCMPLFARTPQRGTAPIYRLGLLPVTSAGHAGWALGISKQMLDDVTELAKTKARMSDMDTLANRQTFQRNLGHHLGMWRAARAGVMEAFNGVEQAVDAGVELTAVMRSELRIAATFATEASREITQWAHLAAGTSAIRDGSGLERGFRDMYTGSQHAFISEKTYMDSAQIYMGLVDDLPGV